MSRDLCHSCEATPGGCRSLHLLGGRACCESCDHTTFCGEGKAGDVSEARRAPSETVWATSQRRPAPELEAET